MLSNQQFEDQYLGCADCGAEFVFSANDQEFYAEKNYSAPKRCPDCRAARKRQRGGGAVAAAVVAEAAAVKDLNLTLSVMVAVVKRLFHLNHLEIVLYIVRNATKIRDNKY